MAALRYPKVGPPGAYGVDLQRNRNARYAGSEVKLGGSGAAATGLQQLLGCQ